MEIIKKAYSVLRPFIMVLIKDRWVVLTTSLFFGSIATSLWPKFMGWGLFVIFDVAFVYCLVKYIRKHQDAIELTTFELALRQPDSDAFARMHDTENQHFLVINQVIEVRPHYTLNSRASFASLGWSPDEISVHFNNEYFDASRILASVGGKKNYDPPNGRKFCLVDRSLAGTDTDLALYLRETDYFTIRSVISNLPFSLRTELGSLDPTKNLIPHSLCLHFIVRCDDGSVLLLLNEKRKAYAGGTWSVSAEEQMKDLDLTDQQYSPLDALFKRALLEEVFGLRDVETPLSERWAQIEDHVRSIRIWSIFLEEHINNFSLLGVCQLTITPDSLRKVIKKFIDDGSGSLELEGTLHFTSRNQLEQLLIRGTATATKLFPDSDSDRDKSVFQENLHWTSRYRIFRLLRALNGKPLSP